jgi:integrase
MAGTARACRAGVPTQSPARGAPDPAPHSGAALTDQEKERVTAGSLRQSNPCVFTTPIGTPTDPRNDFRQFKKLLARADLPSVRLHDLRHTAASLLLVQNVPARVVMEILGHSQIALTMNTYSHVAPEVSRAAADRMGRMLWRTDDDPDQDDHDHDQPAHGNDQEDSE